MNNQRKPVLEVENIAKFFGGVEALKNGSLKLFAGEVLAIVGANGAGKSTLIKIIAGVLNPDQGFVRIRGKKVENDNHNVAFMRHKGLEVVYQDLAIVPNMSAPYNLFLGRIPRKFGIFVDEKKMLENAEELTKQQIELDAVAAEKQKLIDEMNALKGTKTEKKSQNTNSPK